jgi:hypothetical protein
VLTIHLDSLWITELVIDSQWIVRVFTGSQKVTKRP